MSEADETIPVMRPLLPPTAAIATYLDEMGRAGWFTNFGLLSRRLEDRVAARVGASADRVVAVANATLGLAGALAIADAKSWTLPSWTFTATAAAAVLAGTSPMFADVDPTDWWVNEKSDADHGVLRAAPFGDRVDDAAWCADGELVIDAAASLGMVEGSLSELPPGVAVVFSLHATKVLGAGEGGIVVFGDAARAARFRAWTNYGFAGSRTSSQLGVNAKMSEPAAACALAALDAWSSERAEWLAARELVDGVLAEVGLPGAPGQSGRISPYSITVLPDRATLGVAIRTLAEHKIGTRCWWGAGCHRMAAYQHLPRHPLPVTERLTGTVLGLPMFRGLSPADADRIGRALEQARSQARSW